MTSRIKAWHFTALDKHLGYEDRRLVEPGKTLSVEGPPEMCTHGLHASKRALDALKYAPGPYLWRVDIWGNVIEDDDKLVGTHREALAGFDATKLLRRFSRMCALDVVHLWDAPDVVLQYLKTGNPELKDAAWDATRNAAQDAARAAARAAAWAAARNAAWDAARNAAWAAAQAAAWNAAWDAARAAAWNAAQAAAWNAARAAAWAAAWSRQSRRLNAMIGYALKKETTP